LRHWLGSGEVFLNPMLEQMPAEKRLAGIPAKDPLNGLNFNAPSLEKQEKLMAQLKTAMKNRS